MKTGIDFKIMMDPQKYGYKECGHCNGYGSSFKDPEGVNQCTKCGGSGLTMMTIDETIIVSDQEICPEGTCHDITVVLDQIRL